MCTNNTSSTTTFSMKDIQEEIVKTTRTDVETQLKEHVAKVVAEISKAIHDTALADACSDSVPRMLIFSIDICRYIPNVLRVRRNNSDKADTINLSEAGEANKFNEVYNADFCEALKKTLTDDTHGFILREGCSYTYEASYALRNLVGLSNW